MLKTIILAALVLAAPVAAAAASLDEGVGQLEAHWAQANYAISGKAAQVAAFDQVVAEAEMLAGRYPGSAEPLVWKAVAETAKAGVIGGLTGFKLVKAARTTLEAAEKIDPNAANGLGLSQLGTLYYQVPGFPVAFGDRAKAGRYIKRALQVAPDSIAVNLAYADYLATGKEPFRALDILRSLLRLKPRRSQVLADNGRRAEAMALLALVQSKLTPVHG